MPRRPPCCTRHLRKRRRTQRSPARRPRRGGMQSRQCARTGSGVLSSSYVEGSPPAIARSITTITCVGDRVRGPATKPVPAFVNIAAVGSGGGPPSVGGVAGQWRPEPRYPPRRTAEWRQPQRRLSGRWPSRAERATEEDAPDTDSEAKDGGGVVRTHTTRRPGTPQRKMNGERPTRPPFHFTRALRLCLAAQLVRGGHHMPQRGKRLWPGTRLQAAIRVDPELVAGEDGERGAQDSGHLLH